MLDSLGPFKRKKQPLFTLNFFQLFKSRFGIGNSLAKTLCFFSGIHPYMRVHKLVNEQYESEYSNAYLIKRVKSFFLTHQNFVDNLLTSFVFSRINLLKNLKTLRGRMHTLNLPVRGQRNRTNARTQKDKDKLNLNTEQSYSLDPKKLKKKNKVMPKPKKGKTQKKK